MKWWIFLFSISIIFSGCAKGSEEVNMEDIRKPAVAGSWYPGDKDSLTSMIKTFMDEASVDKIDGRIFGLIAPHAGYVYSGPVAAYSFKALMQNADEYRGNTVILIGFAHRPPNWGGISVWAKGAWETPLGKTKVNEELAQKIIDYAPQMIQYRKDVHTGEHSLEIELPFLQYALNNDFTLVPIAFSHQTGAEIETLTNALLSANIDWSKTILVVSTDMSHYLPYDRAVATDQKTLEFVLADDVNGLIGYLQSGVGAFCGWAGVLTAMTVMPKVGASKIKLLKYANSGDTQPSTASHGVVGYCAVAFIEGNGDAENSSSGSDSADKSKTEEAVPGTDEYSLTKEQKLYLLKLARRTIEELVQN
ncbi:AmmeMemoRadiSam system protein B, partial [bacterium]